MALQNFNYYNRAYYYYLRTLGSVDPDSYMQSLRKRKVGRLKVRVVVNHEGLTQQERVESPQSNSEWFEDDIVISYRRQK